MIEVDRIAKHIDVVEAYQLLVIGVSVLVCCTLIPSRYRLRMSLILVVVWMSADLFSLLPEIAALAKVTSPLALLFVIYGAVTYPGKKRRISRIGW